MLLRETRRSLSERAAFPAPTRSFVPLPALASRRAHLLRASATRVCSPPPWNGAPRSPPLPAVGTPDPPHPPPRDGVTGKFVTALTRAWCRALLLLSGVTLSHP